MDDSRPFNSREMARRGRLGAYVTLSRHNPVRLTQKARDTFIASFTDKARVEALTRGETISDAEAARRGEAARRAFYCRLSAASVKARRRGHLSTARPQPTDVAA